MSRRRDSFGRELGRTFAREGKDIARGVGSELLSIATLGFYKPSRSSRGRIIEIRYPNGKIVKIRR
jgi:hypothetical protein